LRRFRILTFLSISVIVLSGIIFIVGIYLYTYLGQIGDELPVKTVDQFRNIANMMPLVSELSADLDELRDQGKRIELSKLAFTINKLRISQDILGEDYSGSMPYDLRIISEEITSISEDLSRDLARDTPLSQTTVILYKNRVMYVYTELRDYILRINNEVLLVLERQRAETLALKEIMLISVILNSFGVVMTMFLLHSRRKLFTELEQSKLVAISNSKSKSEFLSNMSHEIRTPMNTIVGLSYLALKTNLTPSQRDYLTRIQASSQHLLGVINDILDVSKIEAGKMMLEEIPFELEKVLDNVANLTAEKAGGKNLELIFDVEKGVPNQLIGDPLRLGQILINYANNAVKFTEKGEITISVRVKERIDQNVLLRFAVADTGIGISEEQRSKIFQNFQQADSTVTRRYGGSGLGLVISKNLAEMMHGEVGFESVYGKGSTFWFTALVRTATEKPRKATSQNLQGRRVLVVDDNDHARAVMLDMLLQMSLVVTAVSNGIEALKEIARCARERVFYDVIFLDWQMPEIDGIETARRILAMGLVPKPHIVLVTAYGREEVVREAEAEGIGYVLIKPVSASILFDTIMHFLGARSHETPVATEDGGAAHADLAGARVLLVDDNEDNRLVGIEILKSAGCAIDTATNGEEAIRRIVNAAYDVVLMDIQMPIKDGLAATREVRKIPGYGELPIIAMTANATIEDRNRCFDAGMNDYVSKPVDPDVLFSTLQRYCARNPQPTRQLPNGSRDAEADALRIEGVNTSSGLRRVLGNREFYIDLLRRFCDGQSDVGKRIAEALAADDYVLAERLAHTLKGGAGNIGATDVQAKAAGLEQAIGEKQGIAGMQEDLGELSAALEATIRSIKAVLPDTIHREHRTRPDPQRIAAAMAALSKIERHVANNDAEALDCLDASRDVLSEVIGAEELDPLAESIKAFDFVRASERIGKALDNVRMLIRMFN
jgi:two-component system sensor histidine kinase/response regulator